MLDLDEATNNALREIDLATLRGLRLQAHVAHRARRVGDRVGKGVGGRVEFVDHRPYAPGDDLRRVDWNAAARTDRLVVKRHAHDSALPVHLGIDLSRSMGVGDPSALAIAQEVARGLAYVALSGGATVTVVGLARSPVTVATVSRRGGLSAVETALRALHTHGDADVGRALRAYAGRARDTGVFVLLTDMLDGAGARECLRSLRPFESSVVHLISAALFADPTSGPLRVQDAETGAERDLVWDDSAASAYARRRDELLRHMPSLAAGLGIRYASVRTDRVGPDVFLKEFRNAGIVG